MIIMDIKLTAEWQNDTEAVALRKLVERCFTLPGLTARTVLHFVHQLNNCEDDEFGLFFNSFILDTADEDFLNGLAAMKLIRRTKNNPPVFFEDGGNVFYKLNTLLNKIEVDRAYPSLASRIYRYERSLMVKGIPVSFIEEETMLIKKARNIIDAHSEFDPHKLKKALEATIIHDYVYSTRIASCLNCAEVRYCPDIPSGSLGDQSIPEIPHAANADKNCHGYAARNLAEDIGAQNLHKVLAVMHKKYGVDKDVILNNI